MRLQSLPSTHLTYCTNIHPGEDWWEVRRNLETHVLSLRSALAQDRDFGIGLRLSDRAARNLLAEPGELSRLKAWLAENQLYVFTINGFPYGPFHGDPVKERVYRPDWLEDERFNYTTRLAMILSELLPEGIRGSISTVPCGFEERIRTPGQVREVGERLRAEVVQLSRLEDQTGRQILLALEPEPWCYLETADDAVGFFQSEMLASERLRDFAELAGLSPSAAEVKLRRHLGVCLDACHLAVEWETPAAVLSKLEAEGIAIGKVQLSAGLELDWSGQQAEKCQALEAFAEGVYLHQVVEQSSQGLRHYLDLPEALGRARAGENREDAVWRIHFHVPIHQAELGLFRSTQPVLRELLQLLRQKSAASHLEIETYTWEVLPEAHRQVPVEQAIAQEFAWVFGELG